MEHHETVIEIGKPFQFQEGLEFSNLTYTISKKKKINGNWTTKEVDLLHKITGYARKGCVTAVLGPSGAGKSTLLDALAGRIAIGSLKGSVLYNGVEISPTIIKGTSAYVMQNDRLFPMLTVYETLLFAADLRLGPILKSEKMERVEKLIEQLGLSDARNTYIGDEDMRGVSGGERRRVSIGVDIIHGPSLLFLDEPTSGLDSTCAKSVVEKVYAIARSGSTVILTIHQPSSRILHMFDHLIVLARGQLMYQGAPVDVPLHLEKMGLKVPMEENPIEFLMDAIQEYDQSSVGVEKLAIFALTGIKPPPLSNQEISIIGEIPIIAELPPKKEDSDDDFDYSVRSPWNTSGSWIAGLGGIAAILTPTRQWKNQKNELPDGCRELQGHEIGPNTSTPRCSNLTVNENDYLTPEKLSSFLDNLHRSNPKFANSLLSETWILMRRNLTSILRTRQLFLSRLMVMALMGFILGTMFLNPKATMQGITSRLSVFSFTICLFFYSSIDAVPIFILERFIFVRETSHNAYRASSYTLASIITHLPFLALQTFIYAAIIWLPLKLRGSFIYFLINLYVSLVTANSFVVFISSAVPSFVLGYAVVIAFTSLFFLFCGYFLNGHEIPGYWRWMHKVSMVTYSYEGLLINQYQTDDLFATSPLNITGRRILAGLHIDSGHDSGKWEKIYVMLGFAMLYRVLFYMVLRFGTKNQRT